MQWWCLAVWLGLCSGFSNQTVIKPLFSLPPSHLQRLQCFRLPLPTSLWNLAISADQRTFDLIVPTIYLSLAWNALSLFIFYLFHSLWCPSRCFINPPLTLHLLLSPPFALILVSLLIYLFTVAADSAPVRLRWLCPDKSKPGFHYGCRRCFQKFVPMSYQDTLDRFLMTSFSFWNFQNVSAWSSVVVITHNMIAFFSSTY